jgi:hypothetical protein
LLMREVQIVTPDDLKNVLQMVRALLASGALSEDSYWPVGQLHTPQPPFSALGIEGPWPDYFEYYFRCAINGRLYRLFVETYHGTGGGWQPLPGE